MADHYTQEVAHNFLRAVKRSAEYIEYEKQLKKMKQKPELFAKVNEFRQKNYEIHNMEAPENLMDRMDELDWEYEELREIPLVEDFLNAETAFCRMMQEINLLVIRELDFQ